MREHARIIRFLIAGSLAVAVNWLARIALSWAFAPALSFELAVVIAYAIGMACGFALYRGHVFPEAGLPLRVQATRFLGVNLLSAGQVWAVSVFLVRAGFPALGMTFQPEAVAHALAIALGAVTSYAGHRWLTFRPAAA